ncbi:Eco57I restriction-modification methylase domain-containing protein [uncultured Methanoregula sp.]|uniref:Eco57I restriction-modification methylase domain-containing protein n=1 Tax=uncultured Methanoregula sp. TaxID=1005933 RepID=UPI002AAB1542|nr:hypothetical protein [uncultured Methanoregula sp.]
MAAPGAEKLNEDRDMPDNGAMLLLHDLTRWREQLARSIARNNLELRSDQITFAVNRILFPLLILRIAEDRNLVPAGTLASVGMSRTALQIIRHLAPCADALYADRIPDPLPVTGSGTGLILEERVMSVVLEALANPDRRYDCGKMDDLVLGQVLMQYLTRTIRRSATHQATVVDTHDTVVSGGTVAPPLSLVEYLGRQALDSARNNRSMREVLPLRVLDPACGSGTVLLAVYRHLLEHAGGSGLTFEERFEILVHSVYGLDVNRHAVAATRMLLFFVLFENHEPPGDPGDLLTRFQSVMHDLRHTILCGNALVGPEIVKDESWMFCPARDRHTLNPFSYRHEFSEVVACGGFDAVVCNPPEGMLEQREWIQQYFQRRYTVYHPAIDRSAFFLEKSLLIVRPGGVVSFVMSGRWLRGAPGSNLREMLGTRQIEEIVDLTGIPAGEPGGGLSLVRVRAAAPTGPFFAVTASAVCCEDPWAFVPAHRFPVDPRLLKEGGWALRDTRVEDILRKVGLHSTTLEDFVMGEVHAGIRCTPDDPFVISETLAKEWLKRDPRCKKLIRRFIPGTEIGSFCSAPDRKFRILVPQGWTVSHVQADGKPWRWFRHRHPLIARHLQPFEEMLKSRAGPDALWWETACAEFWQEPRKKILFPSQFSWPVFLFDTGRGVGDETSTAIPSAGLYLFCCLRSRLLLFVFYQTRRKSVQGREFFSWVELSALPVYTPDLDQPEDRGRHDRIEAFGQRLMDLEKNWHAATTDPERNRAKKKIEAIRAKIDALVYELYGLTPEEIAVVEGISPS